MHRTLRAPVLSLVILCEAGWLANCGNVPQPPPAAPVPRLVCPPCPACTTASAPAPKTPAGSPGALPGGPLSVDPEAGRNSFSAVFDAPLGERITAQASAVQCTAAYDGKANTFSGTCSVPLMSITVDNDDTKTEHFQQWSTNKKSDPKDCKFEAKFDGVKPAAWLTPGVPANFSTDAVFTICGRARTDGGKEHVTGSLLLMPADQTPTSTVRVRAEIEHFSRDAYHIGPAYTDGWLARVQKLAPVVSDQGTVTLSLFAKASDSP